MLRRYEQAHGDALAEIQCVAFAMAAKEDAFRWWESAGTEHLRVWLRDGQVAGGLLDIPMGVFVGGRRVPLHGVAGVAVAAEARGSGVGSSMMAAYLQELASAGVATSALYASTRGLYRKVGYEVAGERWIGHVQLDALRSVGRRDGRWRAVTEEDWAALEQAYTAQSTPQTGRMDRGPYLWNRVRAYRGTPNRAWFLPGRDGPQAWVVIRSIPGTEDFGTVELVDHGAIGPVAWAQLVGFLSTFGAMARTLKIAGPTPIWEMLTEHRVDLELHEPWMLRITDLRRALEGRGWPAGLTTTLSIQVEDPVVRANSGRFTVRIAEGEANVQAGGDGLFRMGIGALASLYTGHADPWTLHRTGRLEGPADRLGALALPFAGPRPGLGDFF